MTIQAPSALTFQDLILKLQTFWADYGCVLQQPYDLEVGAGTMSPETFLRVLGPKTYRVAYLQPSRRPADGRYGENPNRFERLQIHLLHIYRRRLQDELKLRVLEQPVRVLAVASVRGSARWLCIAHPVWLRPQHAQKRLRRHRARTYLNVVRLLQHAPALGPEALQPEQQILKRER